MLLNRLGYIRHIFLYSGSMLFWNLNHKGALTQKDLEDLYFILKIWEYLFWNSGWWLGWQSDPAGLFHVIESVGEGGCDTEGGTNRGCPGFGG